MYIYNLFIRIYRLVQGKIFHIFHCFKKSKSKVRKAAENCGNYLLCFVLEEINHAIYKKSQIYLITPIFRKKIRKTKKQNLLLNTKFTEQIRLKGHRWTCCVTNCNV